MGDGEEKKAEPSKPKGFKEGLYEKVTLSVRQLDIIIVVLLILTIIFFVVGSLVGNGIIDGPRFFG
ncbi:MAG: hypothetical protein LBT59_11035 [Clostridiales bacterium]|jgi:hypothetical protein|nr:hypothetical protein [Clostridiales bacterium]